MDPSDEEILAMLDSKMAESPEHEELCSNALTAINKDRCSAVLSNWRYAEATSLKDEEQSQSETVADTDVKTDSRDDLFANTRTEVEEEDAGMN